MGQVNEAAQSAEVMARTAATYPDIPPKSIDRHALAPNGVLDPERVLPSIRGFVDLEFFHCVGLHNAQLSCGNLSELGSQAWS